MPMTSALVTMPMKGISLETPIAPCKCAAVVAMSW